MQNKNNRGGINFDAKIRRNSTDPADLFYARIGGMDTFARALIVGDKFCRMVNTPNSEKNAMHLTTAVKEKNLKKENYRLKICVNTQLIIVSRRRSADDKNI
jgi:xylose isomerase